jgi:hypothetical protein
LYRYVNYLEDTAKAQTPQSDSPIPATEEIAEWLENSDVLGADWMAYPDKPHDDFLGYKSEDVPSIIQSALRKWSHTVSASNSEASYDMESYCISLKLRGS